MPLPQAPRNLVTLSTDSVFIICDGLLRMSHTLMIELPEPQLRDVCYLLDIMLARADQLLDSAEYNFSLNFNGLVIDPEAPHRPSAKDFDAVLVSTTVSTTSDETKSSASSSHRSHRGTTTSQPPVPAPGPALTSVSAHSPTPVATHTPTPVPPITTRVPVSVSTHGDNVGFPDYTRHSYFVRPGIPGTYQHPPTESGFSKQTAYYVVSRGLYVGIFSSWDEIAPWVIGVSGSVFRKTKSWDEARDLYNARLAAGAIQILSTPSPSTLAD